MEGHRDLKLLVDRTAGKLARWLRILGLDTEYVDTCDPSAIAKFARQSGRMVITRNRNLARRLMNDSILLKSEHLKQQLRQVVQEIGPERCDPFSRCNICNVILAGIEKERVRGRVPEYVYANHHEFSVCPVCGRYYWRGTHWQKMIEEIEKIVEVERDADK